MVSIAGVTSPIRTVPYITPDMFKAHGRGRGVPLSRLVPKGNEAEQDAALAEIIESASAWADSITGPAIMAATMDTVQENVNVDRHGYARIFPRYRPIVGLTEFWIGPSVGQLRQIADLSNVDIQENSIKVPVFAGALLTSDQGPIQFGAAMAPWDQALVRYTYVNGYPVTLLTAAAAAGASQLQVADTTGIVAGKTWMTVYALQNRHKALVTAVSTADAGGLGTGPGTITLATVLPSAIDVPDPLYPPMVSALPPDRIEAVVLITRAMIKEQGGGAVSATSASSRASNKTSAPSGAAEDYIAAEKILRRHAVEGA